MTALPQRHVQANCVFSASLPPVRIQVDSAFTSVGGPCFVLYGVAYAEQHLFVIADAGHAVTRMVWVQFEGYLPGNHHTYDYPSTETIVLGPYAFLHDAYVQDLEASFHQRPDSDAAHARTFLQGRGYQLGGEMICNRFVHLVGDDKRNELMIIYAEDLRMTGFRVTDFDAGGAAVERWPRLAHDALERALTSLSILPR